MRASEDLPDAVGPITRAPFGRQREVDVLTGDFLLAGGATAAFWTTSVRAGGLSAIGSVCGGR